jgi:hypothetical protein
MSTSNSIATQSTSKTAETEEDMQIPDTREADQNSRDPGVSDAIWQSLQNDKKLAELKDEQAEQEIRDQEEAQRQAVEVENKATNNATALVKLQAKNEAEAHGLLRKREEARVREMEAKAEEEQNEAKGVADELLKLQAENEAKARELLRKREEARIRSIEAKAERERIQREVERLRKQESERKSAEQRAQVKLRQMGICPMGFRWIKQSGGYRCSAGGHWVSDSSLGL